MATPTKEVLDTSKLEAFVGKMVGDVGAAISAALVMIGDRTGLYRALDAGGPQTPAELAKRSGNDERYIAEWLGNQSASGYVTYDAKTKKYTLPAEHAMVLAREESPVNFQGLFDLVNTCMMDVPKIVSAFKDGSGVGWHEHHPQLFPSTDRFFRPGYQANLTTSWIPALEGVEEKLKKGAKVADVGCGLGSSTVVMAAAYPEANITGFDYHGPSVELAKAKAKDKGLSKKVAFEVAGAQAFPGKDYDFIACFDCIHDMGDPEGALRHIRDALKPDGTLMVVEPFAHDALEANHNPVGRVYFGFSTILCTPSAKSQAGGYTMGAQAGEARMREVAKKAGFKRFRRATETPFNIVYEMRP
jgi:ubiquinone/menaquinone biosynthesis C-methylase UbiE